MAITHLIMSPEEWAKVPESSVQRNTILHANKASRMGGHLATPADTHQSVIMARTPDKKYRWKIDGHSRDFLWQSGLLTPPEKLIVTCYEVKNKAAAEELYYQIDSSESAESNRDKLFGAFRKYNFTPKHGYIMQNCGIIGNIDYVVFPTKWADVKFIPFLEKIKPWIATMKKMDGLDLHNHLLFRAPIMLGCMMTIRAYPDEGLAFMQGYHDDIGVKNARNCDGIFAARAVLDTLHIEMERKFARSQAMYTPYFLKAFDNWKAKKRMSRAGKILGKKLPKDILSVREWWRLHLGPLDHKPITSEERDDQGELAI